jgi:hypothetical protein
MNYTIQLSTTPQPEPEQEWEEKKRAALRTIQAVTMDSRFFDEPQELAGLLFRAEIELLLHGVGAGTGDGDTNGSE